MDGESFTNPSAEVLSFHGDLDDKLPCEVVLWPEGIKLPRRVVEALFFGGLFGAKANTT